MCEAIKATAVYKQAQLGPVPFQVSLQIGRLRLAVSLQVYLDPRRDSSPVWTNVRLSRRHQVQSV